MVFTEKDVEEYTSQFNASKEDIKEIIALANTISESCKKQSLIDAISIFLIKCKANDTFEQTDETIRSEVFLKFVNKEFIEFDSIENKLEEYLYVLSLVRLISLPESLKLLKENSYIEQLKANLKLKDDPEKSYMHYAFSEVKYYLKRKLQ